MRVVIKVILKFRSKNRKQSNKTRYKITKLYFFQGIAWLRISSAGRGVPAG